MHSAYFSRLKGVHVAYAAGYRLEHVSVTPVWFVNSLTSCPCEARYVMLYVYYATSLMLLLLSMWVGSSLKTPFMGFQRAVGVGHVHVHRVIMTVLMCKGLA